jgi:hypothetical protein
VNSLSSSEKRSFRLQSQIQTGNKEYLVLFDLLDGNSNPNVRELKDAFKKRSATASWENTCNYLSRLLLDSLVSAKKDKDVFFDLLHEIMEVKILSERSLDEEAFKQIKKLRQKASQYQQHWIEYFCCRTELNFHSGNNFSEMDDDILVRLQMKGKDVLKNLNQIHDHYSLYELLKYRLNRAGKIVSEEGMKKLNDLVLSEMVLVAGKAKSFSSQKLHLLFQSFFFTDIGDYHSASKSFHKLNELLAQNEGFLDNPPLDYLSALTGIIDSLRMVDNHSEVSHYLDKIKTLDQNCYPEFFRYLVRKTFCTQHIVTLLHSSQLDRAIQFINSIPPDVFDNYSMVDDEKQSELYFYCALVNFKTGRLKKAHLFIREITNRLKLPSQLLISKAIRLLNIIIFYEKGELLHLEYEIRSYKRFFAQARLLKIEKLLFKVITSSAGNKRLRLTSSERRKLAEELEVVKKDRYELQLLKYFDFSLWTKALLEEKQVRNETPGRI